VEASANADADADVDSGANADVDGDVDAVGDGDVEADLVSCGTTVICAGASGVGSAAHDVVRTANRPALAAAPNLALCLSRGWSPMWWLMES
jgi:hypothetical protein